MRGISAVPIDIGLTSLLESVAWYRQLKLPVDAVLRSLQAECESNLSLLRLVRLDDGDSAYPQDDPAYIDVALQLRWDALRLVMGGDDLGDRVSSELRRVQFALPDDMEAPIIPDTIVEPENVEDRVRRLAVAVASARVAAELLRANHSRPNPSAALRNIRLRQRLQNLNAAYQAIADALRFRAA